MPAPCPNHRARRYSDLSERQRAVFATPSGFAKLFLGLALYPCQAEALDACSPLHAAVSVKAANEVGKTSRIVAPLVLWHLAVFPRGQVVSTAGAWRQVKSQLIPNLKAQASRFPRWSFNDSGVVVDGVERYVGFSTNDAGKFEGYHGDGENPLLVIVDEAKTVKDDIFEAVDRCNPQRMLLASSPGYAEGEFYRSHSSRAEFYRRFTIQAKDCPHISQESIDRRVAKWGLQHPLVRSMIFAEFMEFVEDAILTIADLDGCLEEPPAFNRGGDLHAFCDFAAGGDENVLAVRQGNKVWIEKAWLDREPMSAVGQFVILFNKLAKEIGLRAEHIEGDADGLGKPMVDRLREAGWPILEFHGGSAPVLDAHYANRIAEVWFEGAKAIREKQIILREDDDDFRAQACDRKQRKHSKGLLAIEAKDELRKRNRPSPDRADAVLAAILPCPSAAGRQVLSQRQSFGDRLADELDRHAAIPEELLAGLDAGS